MVMVNWKSIQDIAEDILYNDNDNNDDVTRGFVVRRQPPIQMLTMKSVATKKKSLHVLLMLLLLLRRLLLFLTMKTLIIHDLKFGNENTTSFKNILNLITDVSQFVVTRTNRMDLY